MRQPRRPVRTALPRIPFRTGWRPWCRRPRDPGSRRVRRLRRGTPIGRAIPCRPPGRVLPSGLLLSPRVGTFQQTVMPAQSLRSGPGRISLSPCDPPWWQSCDEPCLCWPPRITPASRLASPVHYWTITRAVGRSPAANGCVVGGSGEQHVDPGLDHVEEFFRRTGRRYHLRPDADIRRPDEARSQGTVARLRPGSHDEEPGSFARCHPADAIIGRSRHRGDIKSQCVYDEYAYPTTSLAE